MAGSCNSARAMANRCTIPREKVCTTSLARFSKPTVGVSGEPDLLVQWQVSHRGGQKTANFLRRSMNHINSGRWLTMLTVGGWQTFLWEFPYPPISTRPEVGLASPGRICILLFCRSRSAPKGQTVHARPAGLRRAVRKYPNVLTRLSISIMMSLYRFANICPSGPVPICAAIPKPKNPQHHQSSGC